MTDDLRFLAVMLVVFWGVWWVLALVGRRSYIPIIPLCPLAFATLGFLLNKAHPWAGTIVTAVIHAFLLIKMLLAGFGRTLDREGTPRR